MSVQFSNVCSECLIVHTHENTHFLKTLEPQIWIFPWFLPLLHPSIQQVHGLSILPQSIFCICLSHFIPRYFLSWGYPLLPCTTCSSTLGVLLTPLPSLNPSVTKDHVNTRSVFTPVPVSVPGTERHSLGVEPS